ncbi:MAG: carboxymuconolactone decarboxylase family protein [bacterium]
MSTARPRFNYARVAPGVYDAMDALDNYLETTTLEPVLRQLVQVRASQINGCAYCLDMHTKDVRALGETEQRLYTLEAWRECNYYTDRERAALTWTEAVTRVWADRVPTAIYDEVRAHFTDKEMADLTLAVATINAWNRLAISARLAPGHYQPTPPVMPPTSTTPAV